MKAGVLTALMLVAFFALTQTTGLFRGHTGGAQEQGEPAKDTTDVGTPTGDDPWTELSALVSAYDLKEGMHFKGMMKLIDDNGDAEKILEETPFEYFTAGNEFYYSLGKIEAVSKKDLLLLADHNSRVIVVADGSPDNKGAKKMFDIADFKKLMEQGHANAVITRRGNEKVLTIDNIEHPDIQGYRIYYNPVTYRISRMLIGMARPFSLDDATGEENVIEQPADNEEKSKDIGEAEAATDTDTGEDGIIPYYYYLDLRYTVNEKLSSGKDGFYPERKFISVKKENIELTPAYQNYYLINNMDNKQQRAAKEHDDANE